MLKMILPRLFDGVRLYYKKLLLVSLPFYAVFSLLAYPFFRDYDHIKGSFSQTLILSLFSMFFWGVVFILQYYTIKSIQAGYVSIKSILPEIKENFFSFFNAVLKKIVLINLGMILFAIPGIVLAVKWYFVYPSLVFQREKDPFKISMDLTAGKFLMILSLFVIILILVPLFGAVFAFAFDKIFTVIPNLKINSKIVAYFSYMLYLFLIVPISVIFDYEFFRFCQRETKQSEFV